MWVYGYSPPMLSVISHLSNLLTGKGMFLEDHEFNDQKDYDSISALPDRDLLEDAAVYSAKTYMKVEVLQFLMIFLIVYNFILTMIIVW